MIRSIGILIITAVMTGAVLLMARRHRRPSWLLPAFVGAILSGVSAGALFSVMGLINIVQGIRVSGSGGLGAIAAGLWDANQIWRVGLYGSLLAAVLLAIRYFFLPRRQPYAAEQFAPRAVAVFVFSILPLLGSVVSLVTFDGLNDALTFGDGSMGAQSRSLDDLVRYVSVRTWMIGGAALVTLAICALNIPLSIAFREREEPSETVQRAAGALLAIVAFYVLIALTMLIAFSRKMAAAALGLS